MSRALVNEFLTNVLNKEFSASPTQIEYVWALIEDVEDFKSPEEIKELIGDYLLQEVHKF